MRITFAAIVAQWLHAGDSYGEVGETFAPGTPEAVGNDRRDRQACLFLQSAPKIGRRTVRILREQKCMVPAVDVRNIDAAICAEESVTRLGDQHSVLASNDLATLAKS